MDYKTFAPILLRLSLSLLFLWFGVSQLIDQESFVSYVPSWVPIDIFTAVMLNGIMEIVLGVLLAIGFFTRISAVLLAVHLVGIAISLGYNDLAMRDWALAFATVSVALYGPDEWSLDSQKK